MQPLTITAKLSGFYLFYYSIVGTFMPYWNLYLQDQGFNYQQIGILSSIAIITRFFAPLIWGWIADKSGKRMLLVRIATWMEACIWFAIFVIPNSFQSIALLMLVFSFFQNAILAQFEGVTLFWLGEKRAELYGKVRKWGSVGFIVGVFAIGALLEIIPISMLPILLLSVSFLAFLWSFSIKEPEHAPSSQKKLEPLLPILKKPMVAAFFCIEFILLFSQAPFYSFYSNFLKEIGFTTMQIGTLWATGVIAEIVMFAVAQKVFFIRFSWRTLVAICLILTSLRWLLVGILNTHFVGQLLAQCLHAFSFGLFHLIAMKVIFQNFSAEQQGRGQALYSTMWGLGVASGSLLAGHYWQTLSGATIFLCASVVVLLGLILVVWLPNQIETTAPKLNLN
ncbi:MULTISPECIES: MFS transporter [unclassified Acinetobacter]|uniref:MFS transporter n=1 Tax=unclassified Acinetobacter TaxID=196816 RepID=UPI00244C8970|nr:MULTISPECIES: MFS transporter [unclassified Acinetobacter]MDH0030175.1 MFS transporter [Acinetobacter sp. GD04021]MDH0885743.1 MFS transporter [Acinetobacter sp. GD03873]MDH1082363.1 MFS transporter [Acinetobacter sp. GD03983]MDH2189245.1 MFS transporter [Acinetobacter sp. GD03645]MDH2202433.1 MFS transporter [Acinetobacter sp. GD03647]